MAHSRLAPTPSGFLHAGNAFSFVLTWLLVRRDGGSLRLRIDDLDAARVRPEYIADLFETLAWLGLDYDHGPRNPAEFAAHFSQQLRLPLYHGLLHRLRTETGLLYACDCSRTVIQAASPGGVYPGTCRHRRLPLDTPGAAWRIHVPPTDAPARQLAADLGDFVVRRKDGVPAYQVASLADDLHYGTTLVVRGADLLPSTAAQVWLARLLGETAFATAVFHHHPLLSDAHGLKLSKSAGAAPVRSLHGAGSSPAAIFQAVARYLHLPEAHANSSGALLRLYEGRKA